MVTPTPHALPLVRHDARCCAAKVARALQILPQADDAHEGLTTGSISRSSAPPLQRVCGRPWNRPGTPFSPEPPDRNAHPS